VTVLIVVRVIGDRQPRPVCHRNLLALTPKILAGLRQQHTRQAEHEMTAGRFGRRVMSVRP